jgi:hypothetical protein
MSGEKVMSLIRGPFLWIGFFFFKHFSLQPFFSYKALVTALQFIPVDYLDLLPLDYAAVVNVKNVS